jgi:hypothetical protein
MKKTLTRKRTTVQNLATIILDCPVVFNETDYELSTPDVEKQMHFLMN